MSHAKAAREAIANEEYNTALYQCDLGLEVTPVDSSTKHRSARYMLLVLRGVALEKLGREEEAVESYLQAGKAQPDHPLAWQGLEKLSERRRGRSVEGALEDLTEALESLYKIYQESGDHAKESQVRLRLLELVPADRKLKLYQDELKISEGRSKSLILRDIIALLRAEEAAWISGEIEKRRYRLDAPPLALLKESLEREALGHFDLEGWYWQLLQLLENEKDLVITEDLIRRLFLRIPALGEKRATLDRLLVLCQQSSSPFAKAIWMEFQDQPCDGEPPLKGGLCEMLQKLKEIDALDEHIKVIGKIEEKICQLERDYGIEYPKLRQHLKRTLGLAQSRLGNHYEALLVLQDYLKTIDDGEIKEALLQAYRATKQHQAAIDLLLIGSKDPHVITDQSSFETVLAVGEEYFKMSRYEEASRWFELAVKQEESLATSSLAGMAKYGLGKCRWRMSRADCADLFLAAVKANPEIPGAFYYLGLHYGSFGSKKENQVRGEKCLGRALQLDPSLVDAAVELAKVWLTTSQSKSVKERRESAQNVLELLQPFSREHLRHGRLWKYLGMANLILGKTGIAVSALQTALKGDLFSPDDQIAPNPDEAIAIILVLLAEAYRWDGKYQASLKASLRAIDLATDKEDLLLSAQVGAARSAVMVGQPDLAMEIYERITKQNDNSIFRGIQLQWAQAALALAHSLLKPASDDSDRMERWGKTTLKAKEQLSWSERICKAREACLLGIKLTMGLFEEKNVGLLCTGLETMANLAFTLSKLTSDEAPREAIDGILGGWSVLGSLISRELVASVDETITTDLKLAALAFAASLELAYLDNQGGNRSLQSRLWTGLGKIVWSAGQGTFAADCGEQAILANPACPDGWALLGLAKLSDNPSRQDFALAQHCFIKAVSLDDGSSSSSSRWWLYLAAMYRRAGADGALVNGCLEQVLASNTESSLGWYAQASMAASSSFSDDSAYGLLGQAVTCPDAIWYPWVGIRWAWTSWTRLIQTDDSEEEEERRILSTRLTDLLEQLCHNDDPSIANMQVCLLERLGRLEEAKKTLCGSVLGPNRKRILAYFGESFSDSDPNDDDQFIQLLTEPGRLERAVEMKDYGILPPTWMWLEYLRRLIFHDKCSIPSDPPDDNLAVQARIALIKQRITQDEWIKQHIDFDCTAVDPTTLLILAWMMMRIDAPETALSWYQKALKARPFDDRLWEDMFAVMAMLRTSNLQKQVIGWLETEMAGVIIKDRPDAISLYAERLSALMINKSED